MARYTVQAQEDLHDVVAGQCHGVPLAEVVEATENADLFAVRSDGVLKPGDELELPEPRPLEFVLRLNQYNRFVVRQPTRELAIVIHDAEGNPYADADYELEIDGTTTPGSTASDGILRERVPLGAREAKLRIAEQEFELALTDLDPVSSTRGVQSRLNALGYEAGEPDGTLAARTQRALRRFQIDNDLPGTGHADSATRALLEEQAGG